MIQSQQSFAAVAVEFAAVEIVPVAAKIAVGGHENANFAGAMGKGCCFGEVRGGLVAAAVGKTKNRASA